MKPQQAAARSVGVWIMAHAMLISASTRVYHGKPCPIEPLLRRRSVRGADLRRSEARARLGSNQPAPETSIFSACCALPAARATPPDLAQVVPRQVDRQTPAQDGSSGAMPKAPIPEDAPGIDIIGAAGGDVDSEPQADAVVVEHSNGAAAVLGCPLHHSSALAPCHTPLPTRLNSNKS